MVSPSITTRKIALSVKQLTTSPFDEFALRVKAGARVTGKSREPPTSRVRGTRTGHRGLIHVPNCRLSTLTSTRHRSEGQLVTLKS